MGFTCLTDVRQFGEELFELWAYYVLCVLHKKKLVHILTRLQQIGTANTRLHET